MKLPVGWQWKSRKVFQDHDMFYTVSDKFFKFLTWSLLTAIIKKVAFEKHSAFFFVIFIVCSTCIVTWLGGTIVNFFLNRIKLPDGKGKLAFAFFALLVAVFTLTVNISVQSGLSALFENIIVLQSAK